MELTLETRNAVLHIFDPASPAAREIANLSIFVHVLMFIVFLVVAGLLALVLWRYRLPPDARVMNPSEGNTRIEIIWTVTPALILVVVFIFMLRVMFSIDDPVAAEAPEAQGEPLRVEVIGRLWWWEFRIPELGVRSDNELYLPLGRPIEYALTSTDVIHSFWVPELHGKRDNLPGSWNYVSFVPDRIGVFEGNCAEYCGVQHAWMWSRIVVEPEADFLVWAEQQAADAAEPDDPLAERGREIFFEQNCVNCHAIRGTEADENAGPDLTHVASREILAGGVLENTRENMERWLREPEDVKPGNFMPPTILGDEDMDALVAYMMSLE